MGNISKLCGRRSTLNGKRDQRPNCPSGSVNVQAKRLENQNLLKMMKKEVPKPQQRKKKRKKKRRKRKKKKRKKKRNKSFIMHTASSSYKTRRKNSEIFSEFYSIFLSDTYISLQSKTI